MNWINLAQVMVKYGAVLTLWWTFVRLWKITEYLLTCWMKCGPRSGQLVEALRYKPEGRGFDSRLSPFYRTMVPRSRQPAASVSTRTSAGG